MTHPGITLRRQIQSGESIAPFIGIFDAFSATIASHHSPNLFYSGFGFAASHYGLPDIGYISWTDIVQATWRIRQILPEHNLLVDIDDDNVGIGARCVPAVPHDEIIRAHLQSAHEGVVVGVDNRYQ